MDAIFGDSAPIIIATMTARQMVSAYLVFGFFFPLFFFCGISARSRVRARARARELERINEWQVHTAIFMLVCRIGRRVPLQKAAHRMIPDAAILHGSR